MNISIMSTNATSTLQALKTERIASATLIRRELVYEKLYYTGKTCAVILDATNYTNNEPGSK